MSSADGSVIAVPSDVMEVPQRAVHAADCNWPFGSHKCPRFSSSADGVYDSETADYG